MSEPNHPAGEPKQPVIRRFFSHLLVMPRWHRGVLSIALLLGALGITGHVMHFFAPAPAIPATTVEKTPGAKIVETDSSKVENDRSDESFLARHAPMLTRTGLGCIVGFIIGWLFRAFLKMMSLLTLAGAALFAGLSYFHVMNVDFTQAKEKYDSSIHWVTDQAGKLKDAALAHIPTSGSSIFGMFLGFRRKKL